MSEIIKSFLKRMNETTPFIASYIIALLFIHSREIVIIFTEASIDKKLSLLSWENFNPWYPLIFALAYVIIYPVLNMFLKYVTLWYHVTTKRLLEKLNKKTIIEELTNKLENNKKKYTRDIDTITEKYELHIKELMEKLANNKKNGNDKFLNEIIDNLSETKKVLELNNAFIKCASSLTQLNDDENERIKKFIDLPISLKFEVLSFMNKETKSEFISLAKVAMEYDNIKDSGKVWELLERNHIVYSTSFNAAMHMRLADNWISLIEKIRECYDKRRYL